MKNQKALLIIDMQKGDFTPITRRFDAENVIKRINQLAKLFRKAKMPVIYIQHDGTAMGEFVKNTPDWELLDTLNVEATDIRIDKYANDVFYNSKLQSKLIELNVSELFITGSATDFCVESTVQSAITKNYNITVVSNAHTTGDRPNLSAKQVIDHYNWVWQNMIPTKGNIDVTPFEEIKNNLNKI